MRLLEFPDEILQCIVIDTIPEGFKNLALTSRKLYAISWPFIEKYKENYQCFNSFVYGRQMFEPLGFPLRSAIDLILYIAKNPVIARYIQKADFSFDGSVRYEDIRDVSEKDYAILEELLLASPYIRQAGIDHRKYFTSIKDAAGVNLHEPRRCRCYSQHAAAFLLTFLPNVKTLILPASWYYSEDSDKLVDTIVCRAKSPSPIYSNASLRFVEDLKDCKRPGPRIGRHSINQLNQLSPFIALPELTQLVVCHHIDQGPIHMRLAPYMMLSKVWLSQCRLDRVAITCFLRCTPNLKSLRYTYHPYTYHPESSRVCDRDASSFIYAVAECVGATLEELFVIDWKAKVGRIPVGRVFSTSIPVVSTPVVSTSAVSIPDLMMGFQSLQKLIFPLEIVLPFAESDHSGRLSNLYTIVPASVRELSIVSNGSRAHNHAIDLLLEAIANPQPGVNSAIQHIYSAGDDRWMADHATILYKMKEMGIVVERGLG